MARSRATSAPATSPVAVAASARSSAASAASSGEPTCSNPSTAVDSRAVSTATTPAACSARAAASGPSIDDAELDEPVDDRRGTAEPDDVVAQHRLERAGAPLRREPRAAQEHLVGGACSRALHRRPTQRPVAIAPEQAAVALLGPELGDAIDVAAPALGVAAEEPGHADERQHPPLGTEHATGAGLERVRLAQLERDRGLAGEQLDAGSGERQPRHPAADDVAGGGRHPGGARLVEPAELGEREDPVEQQDRSPRPAEVAVEAVVQVERLVDEDERLLASSGRRQRQRPSPQDLEPQPRVVGVEQRFGAARGRRSTRPAIERIVARWAAIACTAHGALKRCAVSSSTASAPSASVKA